MYIIFSISILMLKLRVMWMFQIMSERMSLEKPKGLEPESTHRIENSGKHCSLWLEHHQVFSVSASGIMNELLRVRQTRTGFPFDCEKVWFTDWTSHCFLNALSWCSGVELSNVAWHVWITLAWVEIYPCSRVNRHGVWLCWFVKSHEWRVSMGKKITSVYNWMSQPFFISIHWY